MTKQNMIKEFEENYWELDECLEYELLALTKDEIASYLEQFKGWAGKAIIEF